MGSLLDEPRRLWLRRCLFQIHLWAGIGIGVYVFAISLSGSALVFREELEAELPGAARTVPVGERRVPLEAVKAAVAERYPGYKVAWIRDPDRPGRAHGVWFEKGRDARLALVDPYTARIVAEVGTCTTFWTFLQDLHFYLFAGATGFIINGIGGLLLAVLCLTGVFIWWPGRKRWKSALRISRKAGWKRVNWDLHSAGGMWTLVFVAIWAVTGAYFAFPQPFAAAVGAVLPMGPPPPVLKPPPAGTPMVPVDLLVERARAAVPGQRITWIGLPHHEGDALATIYFVPAGSQEARLATQVYLSPVTAEIQRVDRPSDRKAGDTVLAWFVSLHFGNFGGWPVKVLWFVLGLTPTALFVTGFLMWWNRVLRRSWRRWTEESAARETEFARQD